MNKESRKAGTKIVSCFPYSLLGWPVDIYASLMRVLIVGCGYVGVPLGVELVRQGHAVSGLRRNPAAKNELKAAGIQPLISDVTKSDELKKLPREFDWVVNCVAAGGGAENYRQVYLQGARNLIEWLSATPPKKFVHTSSTSVYAQNDGSIVTEESLAAPDVETSKILIGTEKVLLDAAAQKKFPAVILRVAGIYGPDRGHWFKQFMRGEAKIEKDGERFLNMIQRDDLVGCIIAALKNGRAGEIYNAVDDEPVLQLHFFQWLAQAANKPLPPSAPENSTENRKRGVTNKRVSNRKLKIELGHQFKYPNFRIGYGAELLRLSAAPRNDFGFVNNLIST
jgi:nucleoside-diphosphate-sugar epimerase